MSYYTMKSDGKRREYVVIKHGIPNVNATVMGVKFRGGYAVVEKDSKLYHRLKQLPMLRNPEERPLEFLDKLPFITRGMDIKLIYGADVYSNYVLNKTTKDSEENKAAFEAQELAHLADPEKCRFRMENGYLCKHQVVDSRISNHCSIHILKDPTLQEIGFKIPLAMDSKLRPKVKKKAFNRLKSWFNENKQEGVSDEMVEMQMETLAIREEEEENSEEQQS